MLLALFAGTLLVVTTACSSAPESAEKGAPITLKVGSQPTISSGNLYVAMAKGYFADEGITIEIVEGMSTDAQTLVATKQLDAYFGSLAASYFNGVANGLDVTLAGEIGQIAEDKRPNIELLVRKDGPIKTVADLRGKKISIPSGPDSSTGWMVDLLLRQAGLSLNDVEVLKLGPSDGVAALLNDSVAATISYYPLLVSLLEKGDIVALDGMSEAYSNSANAFSIGPSLTIDNRDAGVRFLRALYRAVDDLKGDYLQDPEISKIISDATQIPIETVRKSPSPAYHKNLPLNAKSLNALQDFFRSRGVLKYPTNLSIEELSDQALMDEAAKSLTH